jgi:hypothetical protein
MNGIDEKLQPILAEAQEQRPGGRSDQPPENPQTRDVRPGRSRIVAGENATVPPHKLRQSRFKGNATPTDENDPIPLIGFEVSGGQQGMSHKGSSGWRAISVKTWISRKRLWTVVRDVRGFPAAQVLSTVNAALQEAALTA